MSERRPLVLADDGLIQQLQASDNLPGAGGLAQILIQNNAIIRLLAGVAFYMDVEIPSDDDIESFIGEPVQ